MHASNFPLGDMSHLLCVINFNKNSFIFELSNFCLPLDILEFRVVHKTPLEEKSAQHMPKRCLVLLGTKIQFLLYAKFF